LLQKLVDWWNGIPYPIRGGLIRAARATGAMIVAILLTALTTGILIPATLPFAPFLVVAITAILQGLDKYFRESQLVISDDPGDGGTPPPLTDNAQG